MTAFTCDTIVTDGKAMSLHSNSPLEQLWEKRHYRPNLNWDSTAPNNGYRADWVIDNGYLWLTNLESDNYTMKDLLVEIIDEKIKAIWFSGDVIYGIGKPKESFLGNIYQDYATYEIKEGRISEGTYKEIQYQPSVATYIFNFGKYKDMRIEDIIRGIDKYKEKIIISNYLKELIKTYQWGIGANSENVYLPAPRPEEIEDLFKWPDRLNVSIDIIDKYIFLKGSDKDAKRIEGLVDALIECFNGSFYSKDGFLKYYKEYGAHSTVSAYSLSIKSDTQYISWVVNNVSDFDIPPHIICGNLLCRELSHFEVNKVAYDIIKIKPVIQEYEYVFPGSILNTCKNRFFEKHGLLYDVEKKWYVKKISEKDNSAMRSHSQLSLTDINYDELYFDAMTDGQFGDYEDFSGNIDDLNTLQRG